MPRNYISKKKKKYDNDAMNNAMEAVNSGRLSIRHAADEFLVNRSTLHDTITKKNIKTRANQVGSKSSPLKWKTKFQMP